MAHVWSRSNLLVTAHRSDSSQNRFWCLSMTSNCRTSMIHSRTLRPCIFFYTIRPRPLLPMFGTFPDDSPLKRGFPLSLKRYTAIVCVFVTSLNLLIGQTFVPFFIRKKGKTRNFYIKNYSLFLTLNFIQKGMCTFIYGLNLLLAFKFKKSIEYRFFEDYVKRIRIWKHTFCNR
jgi:hypothetical protein